jgi:hypothetical protein
MAILTYQALNTLVDVPNKHYLEMVNVDVRRLHDDRAEIQYGDEIALVASFSARLTPEGWKRLKKLEGCKNLAVGDELLVVGTDAEIRSKVIELDNEGVTRWIADHYDFTFLLNGREHSSFREVVRSPAPIDNPPASGATGVAPLPVNPRNGGLGTGAHGLARLAPATDTTAVATTTRQLGLTRYPVGRDVIHDGGRDFGLPWLRRLNTSAIHDDLIDVDVRITEQIPAATTTSKSRLLAINSQLQLEFDDGSQLTGRIELYGDYEKNDLLISEVYRLPLVSDRGHDAEIVFTVTDPSKLTDDPAPGTPAPGVLAVSLKKK